MPNLSMSSLSMPDTLPFHAARRVIERLRAQGYAAYLAGGCVRDLLLGHTPHDYDVATNARPEVVLDLFPQTFAVGAHFGVVLVAEEPEAGSGRRILTEVATFRTDGAYLDGRRPEQVLFADRAEDDVKRRDFTINGLLLDLELWQHRGSLNEAVIDYVGGRADLAAGLIRAIGRARERFTEDKLRMLRAIRFSARLGYELEPQTAQAIHEIASKIVQVSHERVRDELTRMLTEGHARQAFEALEATGLLAEVLPEAARLRGVEQPPQYHPEGDVWTHTLLLLEGLEAGCAPTLAWGALLHDIGKPATFERAADRIRFNGHAAVGAKIAAEICARLRFSNTQTEQILALVANHMRFGEVERMKPSTLKRFFRLHDFEQHLELHRLDALASRRDLSHYQYAKAQYEATPAVCLRPSLLVTGRDLISAGYRPGPQFRGWLALAEDAQLDGRITSLAEGLELIAKAAPQ